jgi:hypothetical protein
MTSNPTEMHNVHSTKKKKESYNVPALKLF